jgi:hypothetical protein
MIPCIYQCWNCKHTWTGKPGPQVAGREDRRGPQVDGKEKGACPKCDHLYCTWLNFKWFMEKLHG